MDSIVPKKWINALFERFRAIYSEEEYQSIPLEEKAWQTALSGVSGDEIRNILEVFKQDKSQIASPDLFRCGIEHLRVAKKDAQILANKIETDICKNVVPLQWPKTKDELLAMTEAQAMQLTPEQRYDRIRLLLEQEGRDNVARFQRIADSKPTNEIKRKDWQ